MADETSSNGNGSKKMISMSEVEKHDSEDDCWIVVEGKVYNVSKFLDEHPGGPGVITEVAGTDATEPFEDIGHTQKAQDDLASHYIGDLEGYVAKKVDEAKQSSESGGSTSLILILGAVVAVGAVAYTQFM